MLSTLDQLGPLHRLQKYLKGESKKRWKQLGRGFAGTIEWAWLSRRRLVMMPGLRPQKGAGRYKRRNTCSISIHAQTLASNNDARDKIL